MFDIILPQPKLAVLYKCRNCGRKSRILAVLFRKKCPNCGGTDLKLTFDMVEEKPPFPIVH
jgi:Zn finger protein HypA/HybF involved in hydrogenase expression